MTERPAVRLFADKSNDALVEVRILHAHNKDKVRPPNSPPLCGNRYSMQEVFVLIAFVGTVTVVFALFGGLLYRLASDRLKQKKSVLKLKDRIVLPLGITGILCVLYGWLIEPYWLSIEHVKLSSEKIPVSLSFRIVQISDLHCDPQSRLEKKLPQVIAAEKPDVIVFTGDALNSPEGLPNLRELMSKLSTIAPTYVVKGNWDCWFFKDAERFSGTGVTELIKDPALLTLKGCDVCVAGLPVCTHVKVSDVLKDVPAETYRIFLYHYPDFIEEMERNKVDLYLAGIRTVVKWRFLSMGL